MPWSEWTVKDQTNLQNVPAEKGVYELGIVGEITYIGQSQNLNERLQQHLNSTDPCISSAKFFRYYQTQNPEKEEEDALANYKKRNGKIPRCNDQTT